MEIQDRFLQSTSFLSASQVDLVDDHASCIKNNQHVIEKAARLLCPLSPSPLRNKRRAVSAIHLSILNTKSAPSSTWLETHQLSYPFPPNPKGRDPFLEYPH
jgi:hypothetical protein